MWRFRSDSARRGWCRRPSGTNWRGFWLAFYQRVLADQAALIEEMGLAVAVNGLTTGTMNWQTFSQVTFTLQVDAPLGGVALAQPTLRLRGEQEVNEPTAVFRIWAARDQHRSIGHEQRADAVLVRHEERPVPLEEVHANQLSYHLPSDIRGYWPQLVAKALAEDLGPLLIFAPRRQEHRFFIAAGR